MDQLNIMNPEILTYPPKSLWYYFEQLNAIPRPSKKEQRVVQWVQHFGKELGLETHTDQIGNVVIRKPATPGREDRPGIVLQGHLDMVHQKNSQTDFDFETQGIESRVVDGWLTAKGTTLGADNGIGVASMMAVLAATDLKHGPLEALFTVDEETGMTGAFQLNPGWLQGAILLNTDTEDEGELCIGCAGGIDSTITGNYQPVPPTPDASAYQLSVTGLKGGHSGCEIHLGRGNANKLMNRLLWNLQDTGFQLARLYGGSLRNAIPRESFADVLVPDAAFNAFENKLWSLIQTIQAELGDVEPNLKIAYQAISPPREVLDTTLLRQLLNSIYAAPCGVIRMSSRVPGLVETSTNLARVQLEKGQIEIQFLSRSSLESAKMDVTHQISACFDSLPTQVTHSNSYPGWQPNQDSKILAIMQEVYQQLFDHPPRVMAVHAGLECGIIGAHYPQMDMISFGPTIKNPHSPDEMCDIASVEKYWRFLVATLERI